MAKNTIGQFIAALRKANGMTQQDVADRLNVSNKAVSRWERDECAPDLSVIPALAEMFGVTCDELLKGERIAETAPTERKEPKVDKQVKTLINRTLSSYRTLTWISLAVAFVGFVCMFGISYGFYRPIIGFAVMLLFEAGAFVLVAIAVSKAREVKTDNELFEMAESMLVERYNHTLGTMSFAAFFVISAVFLLSLPLVLVNPASNYLNSVMSLSSYFTYFFVGIVLFLVLMYLKAKTPYIAWITGAQDSQRVVTATNFSRKHMTWLQVGLTVLAGIIFILAPYLDFQQYDVNPLYTAVTLVGLACLFASLICFVIYLVKEKGDRKGLILPGIRNTLLIPSALIVSRVHNVGWISGPHDTTPRQYEYWNWEFLGVAIAFAFIVSVVFSIVELVSKKKFK